VIGADEPVVDIRSIALPTNISSVPLLLMFASLAFFLVVVFVHLRKIVEGLTAVYPSEDPSETPALMECTGDQKSAPLG
jgi:hypothetical protein